MPDNLKPSDLIRIGVDKDGNSIFASASDASRAKAADDAQTKKQRSKQKDSQSTDSNN